MQPVAGAAQARFSAWLNAATGIGGARIGDRLTGGNANVTRLVETDDGGRLVLRHPPAHAVSDKAAAGIAREYRAISALAGRAPVPRPVAFCDDAAVLGQPFAVTGWLDGVAVTDRLPPAYPDDVTTRDALGIAMVQGLAAVHAIDWQAVLPADFGRPEGFTRRQIDRWTTVRAGAGVRDLPLIAELADWLRANEPPLTRASIIHCDFHLDNCLVARDRPELLAILDWEMATIGDPLIDLGLCLFFWKRDPAQAIGFPHIQAISNHPDVIDRARLAAIWADVSGGDAAQLAYYTVFSAWRLAAIVEGAYVLHRQGKDDSAYARGLERDVPNLLREAAAIVDAGRP